MDCKTATQVYQGNQPLAQIQALFPATWAFLEQQAWAFVRQQSDPFDGAVRKIVGDPGFQFRLVHRDDRDQITHDLSQLLGDVTSRLLLEQHFSQLVGQPLHFSSLCCSSHLTTGRELTLAEVLPLQKAAIQLQ
ncbi:MAG: hypothetical protein VKJ24_11070 [Synechococcales bacterium]|nr:hypothetical protein [Synechococcales bacterium]